jgi:hypothetical protein
MSLVFPKFAPGRFLAALGLAALASANAQQPSPQRGSGIRFTEPEAPVTSTNLTETSTKKPAFSGLDRSARKPFEFFKSEDSFSGVLAPPPQRVTLPVLNSRRAKDLLDRQKNWVFNTPEEMYGIQSPEQMMNVREFGPDGKEKAPKNSFERYVERMEKARDQAATNQVASDNLPSWLKPGDGQEESVFGNDGKQTDHSVFGNVEANSKRTPGNGEFTSLFSSGPDTTTERSSTTFFSFRPSDSGDKPAGKDTARETRMQVLKQLLETGSPVSPGIGDGFGSSVPSSPGVAATVPAFSAGSFGLGSLSPQPATRPATLPSFSPSAALPSYATPALSPPPATTAPWTFTPRPPVFELPKPKY